MKRISEDVTHLFKKQGFAIVSTIDGKGRIHCSAKGIAGIEDEGKVYIVDLYHKQTFSNLENNPLTSITAIDEHTFTGYTLKGVSKIVKRTDIHEHIMKSWEDKIIQRISKRVVKNIKGDRKTSHHPEARLPRPQYLIVMEVEEIVDLAPKHLKR